jgi:outer membrane lipoprotein-sorting protein
MKKMTVAVLAAALALSAVGCGKPPTAKEILDKAAANYSKVKSLRVEAESSTEQRFDNEWRSNGSLMLTEFVRPDKIRQQAVGAPQPSVVSDGKKAYFYMDQAQAYIEVPPDRVVKGLTSDQSGVHLLRLAAGEDMFKGAKNMKLVGEEKVGPVDTYVVEFTPVMETPLRGAEKAKMSDKLWIGKTDYRLYKGQFTMKQTVKLKGASHHMTVTLTSVPTDQKLDATIADSEFALPKGAKISQMPQMMQPSPQGRK